MSALLSQCQREFLAWSRSSGSGPCPAPDARAGELDQAVRALEQRLTEGGGTAMSEEEAGEARTWLLGLSGLDAPFFEAGGRPSFMVVGTVWKAVGRLAGVVQRRGGVLEGVGEVVDACAGRLVGACAETDVEVGRKMRAFFGGRLVQLLQCKALGGVGVAGALMAARRLEALGRDQDWNNLVVSGVCARLQLGGLTEEDASRASGPLGEDPPRNETLKLLLATAPPAVILRLGAPVLLPECVARNPLITLDVLVSDWARRAANLVKDPVGVLVVDVLRCMGPAAGERVCHTALEMATWHYCALWSGDEVMARAAKEESARVIALAWGVDPQAMLSACVRILAPHSQGGAPGWDLSQCAAARVLSYLPDDLISKSLVSPTLTSDCMQRGILLVDVSTSKGVTPTRLVQWDAVLCFLSFAARCGGITDASTAERLLGPPATAPATGAAAALMFLSGLAPHVTDPSMALAALGHVEYHVVTPASPHECFFAAMRVLKAWAARAPAVCGSGRSPKVDTMVVHLARESVNRAASENKEGLLLAAFDAVRALARHSPMADENVAHMVAPAHRAAFRSFVGEYAATECPAVPRSGGAAAVAPPPPPLPSTALPLRLPRGGATTKRPRMMVDEALAAVRQAMSALSHDPAGLSEFREVLARELRC